MLQSLNFSGRTALIMGASQGIGLATAKALAAYGATVVLTARSHQKIESEADLLRSGGLSALAVPCDVSDYLSVTEAIEYAVEKTGRIDILVNNAGITRDGVLHKMPAENWHDVIQTNLTSCFNMCRSVILKMRERQNGRIINISSINGQKGQFGQVNYSAAKAGMIGFTKALALESAAKNVTVNVICPGYIATDMTSAMPQEVLDSIVRQIPEMRMGKPEEIAAIVSFLVSEKAAFVTGATLSANGGQYMA